MRKKKRSYKKIFFVAIGGFLLLMIFLGWSSYHRAVRNLSQGQHAQSGEMAEPTLGNLSEEIGASDRIKEVNGENDVEHIAGAALFPIVEKETYIEPVVNMWSYKIHEKVETFAERYAPDSTEAVCLNSAPSKEKSVLFFLELNDKNKTLIVVEFGTVQKDVAVKECTWYTREEIINGVWSTQGAPAVRDVP